MQTKYTLSFIPGTVEYVKSELTTKFPDVQIEKVTKDKLYFTSEHNDVDDFRVLYSPLLIEKENGLIRNLYRREWREQFAPAGINPALAYVLCQVANLQPDDVVLDPFCGGGTIPITASVYFNPAKVIASDISGSAVDITMHNFKTAHVPANKYVVFRSNVNQLKLAKEYVSKVITNLPFGVRTGNHDQNIATYQALEIKMRTMLKPGGLIVILTQEKELLQKVFDQKYESVDQFDVAQGGLIPRIFVYRKPAG